ncbi:MAG: acyl-CoA thioesterase [Bacteroidetes bacterium]|nr:acyl-CoA thioesterase [Bacteroidota bacterium]
MKISTTEITIRGFHIDVFGHTNNARYLEFLEIARWEAMQELIDSGFFSKRNLGFVVVNININYKNPSFINNVLEIKTQIKSVGNKSSVVHQTVYDKHKKHIICQADVTFVLIDLKTRKAVQLDDELRNVLENI